MLCWVSCLVTLVEARLNVFLGIFLIIWTKQHLRTGCPGLIDDGSRTGGNGLILCADSFTQFDVVQLMNVIRIKWDISSTIRYQNGNPRIYISRLNLVNKVLPLVCPHMCLFSIYKLIKPLSNVAQYYILGKFG